MTNDIHQHFPLPVDRAELARQILNLISDPRSTARQIGRIIEVLPSLRQTVIFSAVNDLKGRGAVRNSTQAVVLIGYNRLKQLVCDFIDSIISTVNAVTSSPHRLTSPIGELVESPTGTLKN